MEKFKKALKWFFDSFIWLGILALVIDIVSKRIILSLATTEEGPETLAKIIPGFLHVTFTINHGAAFSMGVGNETANLVIYSIVACAASIGIVTYLVLKYKNTNRIVRAGLMMIVAGAIGNLIDRWFFPFHGVVDFIDFCGIWNAIFNFADSFIVVAAFMFIIYFIVEEVKDFRKKQANKPAEEKVVSKTEKEMQNDTDENK